MLIEDDDLDEDLGGVAVDLLEAISALLIAQALTH